MTEKKKKPILEEMTQGQKISELCGENGSFILKVGLNKIKVKDKNGETIRIKCVNHTGSDSKVQASLQDETDIKNILAKYGRTGVLPIVKNEALYGDFSNVPSYQEAQNIILKADEQFSLLSADVRKRFDNDPAKFLEFCTNDKNKEEMYKLGLAKQPPKPVEPVKPKAPDASKPKDKE